MIFLRRVLTEFNRDQCPTLAAALSYYALFALPLLLYLLSSVLTFSLRAAYDPETAEQRGESFLVRAATQLTGNPEASREIGVMLDTSRQVEGAWWRVLLSMAGIVFGATGFMGALRTALNRVWGVKPDPEKASLRFMVFKRLLSFGMILALGLLLVLSMVVSLVLAALGERAQELVGAEVDLAGYVNFGVLVVVTVTVFAMIFRFIPDGRIAWSEVLLGAVVTTLLFLLGRFAMQWFFAIIPPGARLGSAAASLAVVLVWVYYSSMILLLGAEATQVYATTRGSGVTPERNAVRVVEKLER